MLLLLFTVKNPLTYIKSLYEEASKGQVAFSQIQDELNDYTEEKWTASDTQKLIEQAFELAEFNVKGKKKKKQEYPCWYNIIIHRSNYR